MSPKSTSLSDARKNIFKIANEVQKPDTHYILTENGKAKAVVMSADEYESLIETIELLSDPKAMENIKQAEKELERGDYVTWDQLKEELGVSATQGFVLAEKQKKPTYNIKKKKKK
jgi:antitoxin YefM